MSKLIFFPNQRKINEEASLWLTRLSRGLNGEETAAFHNWLSESERHRKTLWRIAVVWDEMDSLKELSKLYPVEEWKPDPDQKSVLAPALAAAAILVVVVSVTVVSLYDFDFYGKKINKDVSHLDIDNSYTTNVGERKTFSLPDGSIITLNTDSKVRVDYSNAARNLELVKGEAYFNVAKDKDRPFNVAVAGKKIRAVGTAFNIYLKPSGGVEVTVSEGIVSLTDHISEDDSEKSINNDTEKSVALPISLSSGKRAVLSGETKAVENIDAENLMNHLAWQRGIIIFEGERLEEVLEEVNRYTTAKLYTKDASIKDIRIGGFYKTGDIDSFLGALKNNFNISNNARKDKTIELFHG
ncbi:MAG: FecR domain-containing protein [Porticoccaceae bacterium]|nr:FecR domain-containing protein [Porticoccaceae bacterium]